MLNFVPISYRLWQQSVEHGVQRMGLDDDRESYASKANSQSNTASGTSKEAAADAKPKKMTWATIASQPVKASQTRVLTTLKKKPGMPPPPMIPGKHNMDIGTWVRCQDCETTIL